MESYWERLYVAFGPAGLLALFGCLAALAWLYWRARSRHVAAIRARLHGEIESQGGLRRLLESAAGSDAAEALTAGTITAVDLAWQISVASPAIWDHLSLAGYSFVESLSNPDLLAQSLGDQAGPLVAGLMEQLHLAEAAQHFAALTGAGDAATLALSSGSSLTEAFATGAAEHATHAPLSVPIVSVFFAAFRAVRRAQGGQPRERNLEFASVEVATRAGGGLIGGQVGGMLGSIVAPGPGTLIGGALGAAAGIAGGAVLGEQIKGRHLKAARAAFEQALVELGRYFLAYPPSFQRLAKQFSAYEQGVVKGIRGTRLRLALHGAAGRIVWPDEKFVLLQETLRGAQGRLAEVRADTKAAIHRLTQLRDRAEYATLGALLWADRPWLAGLGVEPELIELIEGADVRLRQEMAGLRP